MFDVMKTYNHISDVRHLLHYFLFHCAFCFQYQLNKSWTNAKLFFEFKLKYLTLCHKKAVHCTFFLQENKEWENVLR